MNSSFWQMNIGQVFVALGMVGSAFLFVWKTAALHGQQTQRINEIAQKVDRQGENLDEKGKAIGALERLASASEKRLELIEQELRDNRNRGEHGFPV